MTAIRYRHSSRDVEIVLDDETPQSDEPIMVRVGHGVVNLTIADAAQMYAGLGRAIADAREWLANEIDHGLRRPGQSLAEMLDEERASNDAVAKHERERWAREDAERVRGFVDDIQTSEET